MKGKTIIASESQFSNLWRAVGRLESNVERLLQVQERLERSISETNRRIARLLYAVIALGGGTIGLLIMELIRS